jgi:hypothetical protein
VALRVIARRLPLDRNAVRRYARAATWQETVPSRPRHPGIIAPYHEYLQRRWDEGAHSPMAPYREITARGFTGCYNTVMYHCRTLPDASESSRAALQQALSTRQAARWMLTHPENLREEDRIILKTCSRAARPWPRCTTASAPSTRCSPAAAPNCCSSGSRTSRATTSPR